MTLPPSDHWVYLQKILAREVPEVANGTVELKAVARMPGRRTKLAVTAQSPTVDPVTVCVGEDHRRVDAIVAALGGEEVDILRWSDDPERFVRLALAPAHVRVTLDRPHHRAVASVPPDQLDLAHGKHDENPALASDLTGWTVEVVAVDV
jgi:N utilization substance protein A